MWRVTALFTDIKDPELHRYSAGDEYPRKGLPVNEARLAELAGAGNRQGRPLIQEVKEGAPPQKKRGRKNAD